jgi:TonB family protein
MIEELLRAALWFNPAVWWLVDRVHAAREEVVDAEAVKYVDGRRNYVRALLAFADAPAVAAAPAFANRRHLFARITRLCEESPMSSRRLAVASCLLAVAIGTSGVYAVSAFPILAGEDILMAPPAPAPNTAVAQDAPLPESPAAPSGVRHSDTPRQSSAGPATTPVSLNLAAIGPRDTPDASQANKPSPPPATVRIRQTPAVLHEVKPVYPVDAMNAGIEGSVEVEVMIGEEGKVTHARVIQSANPALETSALEAARQWLFAKPTEGPVVRTIELTFTLRRTPPTSEPSSLFEMPPDAVRVGGTIKTPMKIRHVPPAYPEVAQDARVSGVVILETLIGRDGRVMNGRILRSIPLLDQAALDAVSQWEFRPTLMNGTPVPVIMTVTVNFVLER